MKESALNLLRKYGKDAEVLANEDAREILAALVDQKPETVASLEAAGLVRRTESGLELSPEGREFGKLFALDSGIGLCLSGAGYKAMLFHLGVMWRLNEAGLLPKLERVASVSASSIAAAYLGLRWRNLDFDKNGVGRRFSGEVVNPIRCLADTNLDGMTIMGSFLVGRAIQKVIRTFKSRLFDDYTLQDLPDRPRFVISATNMQSGSPWQFAKPYMGDYRVGLVEHPRILLAVAVAASTAVPPFLSPVRLDLSGSQYIASSGVDLQREPFTTNVLLMDGSIVDGLALETTWTRYKTILVSDGSQKLVPREEAAENWAIRIGRLMDLLDNQSRRLWKRQVIAAFIRRERDGAYWGIETNIADYQLADALPCPFDKTLALATVSTGLKKIEPEVQERLINWGYAVCDAGLRKHLDLDVERPRGFPYPEVGI